MSAPSGLCQLDHVSALARTVQPGARRERLETITTTIPHGLTAVMGPSGAGKTTLLNLLAGFEEPSSGKLQWNHTAYNQAIHESLTLPIAWMPADFGLWPDLTIAEHLQATAPVGSSEAQVEDWISLFELHPAHRLPSQLSQGEQSRLSLARAVISKAPVLVLDEPCVHLQASLTHSLWKSLTRYWKEQQTNVIYSTHQPELVLGCADHLLILDEGKLLASGRPVDLYRSPETQEVAWILGATNWFSTKEQALWWGEELPHANVRPEQVEVLAASDSSIVMESLETVGPLSVLELRALREQAAQPDAREMEVGPKTSRTLWVAGQRSFPPVGSRVRLRWLPLLLFIALLLNLSGCWKVDEPRVAIAEETRWMLPADGPLVPAPRGLCVSPAGELLVLDTAGRVLIYDREHQLVRKWHMPEYSVGKAEGICVLNDGRIAVADTHYHRVVIFHPDGTISHIFGREGKGPAEFIYPVAITQDPEGFLYVCEYGSNDRCQKLTTDGQMVLEMGRFGLGPGEFQRPSGVVWSEGRLYIVDAFNSRVQVFDAQTGKLLQDDFNQAELAYPYDIASGSTEAGKAIDFWIVEYASGQVTRLSANGELMGRGFAAEPLRTPWGVCYDPEGRLYVADTGNRRIVCWRISR